MASDARAMLQSRAFGSSSSSEDGDAEEAERTSSEYPTQSINNTSQLLQNEHEHEQGTMGTATDLDLGSFEDSFVPAEPPPAPLGNRQRPKTPMLPSRTASRQGGQPTVVRDAAGFIKQQPNGNRGVFERDDALLDMSRNNDTGDATGLADGTTGGEDAQPSFERSASQSMRSEKAPVNVNTTRGKAAGSSKQGSSGSKQQLTLREQEKVIDEVKKDNFSLKLKIYFLEERLAKLAPDQVDLAFKENIEMKVEFQTVRQELKKHKKLLLEATKALEDSQRNQQNVNGRHSRNGIEAQAEIDRLREELQAERDRAEQSKSEMDRMQDRLRGATSRAADTEGLEREVEELEKENAQLRSQVNAQVTMLSARNDEKDQLYDEIEALKQDVLALEAESQSGDRRGSNASHGSEIVSELEDELNAYRDKLSAATLDLQNREKEVVELNAELDQQESEHGRAVNQWKTALDEARRDKDELTDAIEERDQEIKELEQKLDELDALARDDHTRIEKAVKVAEDKDKEVNHLGEEVIGLTEDLEKLGKQIEKLEDEVDEKNARIGELERELDIVDKELEDKQSLHDQVVAALKEKVATSKNRHNELTIQQESLSTEVTFLRNKIEELAMRSAELEEGKRTDERLRLRLQKEKNEIQRQLRDKEAELDDARLDSQREMGELENFWKNVVSEKEQLIGTIRAELKQAKDRLQVREQDLARVDKALQDRENQVRKAGEDHTSDRLSLILEVERLNRDMAHYEADLDRARNELEKKEEELRQKIMEAATLRATNNDVSAQLALQTQTRLGLSDKLDMTTKSLRDAQDELSICKDKLRMLEREGSQHSRSNNRSNADYRDQLSERNALLQNVYQTVDKIVGTDKRKSHQAEMKPHSNFPVFHDNLVARLRSISQIQQTFEKRTKDMEARFSEQISSLKKQQDSRLRQLDRFETSIKAATDGQRQWKQRVLLKQSEVESVKATNSELNQQVSSLKTRVNTADMSPGTNHKIQTLSARASNAEKRLKATQDQLALVEEKFADAKNNTGTAEEQWQARLRELMVKLREAEEKNKRERQGAKERVRELQQSIEHLQQQVQDTNARSQRLTSVLNHQSSS